MFHDGQVLLYDFGTPFDLLKFKPLNFIDQIRFGLTVIYLQKLKNWKKFEQITAAFWLKKYTGPNVYRIIWEPLLKAKFGDQFNKISMAWFWARLATRARAVGTGGKPSVMY